MPSSSYERDGFLFPIPVLAAAEVAASLAAFTDLAGRLDGAPQPLRQLHLDFVWAYELALHPAILDAVCTVLGPEVLVHSSIVFYKPPRTAQHVPWHQDGLYARMAAPRLVSAWIALTPSTVDNGCLRFLRGSHTQGLLPHVERPEPDSLLSHGQRVEGVDESAACDVVLQPGEMSLHHPHIIHGSNPNRSGTARVGFIVRYATPELESCDWPIVPARGGAVCGHLRALGGPPPRDFAASFARWMAARRTPR
jgi:non-haem Fe2+, alpha-ketoglutarate-dependent halogenase